MADGEARPAGGFGPRAGAAASGGLAQAIGEQFSVQASVGGVRGLLESVLPLTLFSVIYAIGHDLRWSVLAAMAPSVPLAAWRLFAREPVSQAVSGVLGLGLGAVIAVRTGHAQNVFLPSIIKNAAYAAGYAISVLVRWPLVGLLLGLMLGEGTRWRAVPARLRVYNLSTWAWTGMFVVRLVVQIPLWLAGAVTGLALVNIVLGLPLFGLVVWLTWWLVRRVPTVRDPEAGPATAAEPAAEADAPEPEGGAGPLG